MVNTPTDGGDNLGSISPHYQDRSNQEVSMSVIKLLCDALRKALVSFSLIIVVIAVLLYYFEDPNPTEYDR